jgi:hypothetical protein
VRVVVAVAALGVAVGPACGGGGHESSGVLTPGSVTYYRDVLPIVGARCAGCHAPGGLGSFSLLSYDEARPYAALVAAATGSGEMPPWLPADGCGNFQGSRRLSSTEIATFEAWAEGGAPAGDPASAPAMPPTMTGPGPDLGTPAVTLDPGAAYQPNAAVTDDYHCFLVDPGLSSAQDLVGFQIHPGARANVHHVLLFAVPPSQLAAAQDKDAAEPGIGWTCFAGTGVGSGTDQPLTIGGWVPGSSGGAFPAGTGINLAAGTRIVMQVHYNLSATAQQVVSDRTTADLYYAAAPVAKRARVLPLANTTFEIPAGALQTVTADLSVSGAWALWGVAPHMHLHGTEIKVTIDRPGGAETCAIDIPRWDFHWQQFYYYQQPIAVLPGDVGHLACTFDNSTGTQPLGWGEKTTDEMCLVFGYLTSL